MLKYIESVSKESWVEVKGLVQIPKEKDGSRQPITGTSQQVLIFGGHTIKSWSSAYKIS